MAVAVFVLGCVPSITQHSVLVTNLTDREVLAQFAGPDGEATTVTIPPGQGGIGISSITFDQWAGGTLTFLSAECEPLASVTLQRSNIGHVLAADLSVRAQESTQWSEAARRTELQSQTSCPQPGPT